MIHMDFKGIVTSKLIEFKSKWDYNFSSFPYIHYKMHIQLVWLKRISNLTKVINVFVALNDTPWVFYTSHFFCTYKTTHNNDYVIEFYYPCNRNCHYSLSIHPYTRTARINQWLNSIKWWFTDLIYP